MTSASRLRLGTPEVDLAGRVVVCQQDFVGGEPPSSIRNSTTGYGSYPTDQILRYLRSLPAR